MPNIIDVLHKRQVIWISPHLDDICFSLGGLVSKVNHGHLLNLFSISNYVERLDHTYNQNVISKIRDGEDSLFAQRCNLSRYNFSFEDPSVLGINPFILTGLDIEVDKINSALIPYLLDQKNETEKICLVSPMGIGGHKNHLSIAIAIIKNIEVLKDKFDLFFYADLPYAKDDARGLNAINLFNHATRLYKKNTFLSYLNEDELVQKNSLISLYKSQHKSEPNIFDFCIMDKDKYFEMLFQVF